VVPTDVLSQVPSPPRSGATGRASGELWELPKHLVILLILLINVSRRQPHGDCCLGTGIEACSGEFSGWIVATGETDRDLWGARGWPQMAHLGNLGHPRTSGFVSPLGEEQERKQPGASTV
jgi:hypothetical protein